MAEMTKLSAIQTAEPFKSLFRIKPETLQDIEASIRKRGYDDGHPITMWKEKDIVVDGHTRLLAAANAGLKTIPVEYQSFKDEDEAIEYARREQFHRRNLDDGDILWFALQLDELGKRGNRGGDRRSSNFKTSHEGLKAAKFAKEQGTSRRKMEEAFYIVDHGDEKIRNQVLKGTVTIHRACQKLKALMESSIKCEFTKTAKGVSVSRAALFKVFQAVIAGAGAESNINIGQQTFSLEPEWIRTYRGCESSYDYALSISHPLHTGLPKLKGGVDAVACYGGLRSMAGDNVELTTDGKSLTISDGATTLTLQFVKSEIDEYIRNNLEIEKAKWHPLPADFFEAVEVCSLTTGPKDMGVLHGFYLDKNEIMTTDRFHGTLYHLEEPLQLENTTLDAIPLRRLIEVGGHLTHYGTSGGWVHFKNDIGAIFSTAMMVGKYPSDPVRNAVQRTEGIAVYPFPQELRASLNRVGAIKEFLPIQDDRGALKLRFVRLRKENGYLLCSAKTKYGEIVDRIKLNPNECPADIDITVVPEHLKDALDYTQEFGIVDSFMFCRVGKWTHVILVKSPSEKKEAKKEEAKPKVQKLRRPAAA